MFLSLVEDEKLRVRARDLRKLTPFQLRCLSYGISLEQVGRLPGEFPETYDAILLEILIVIEDHQDARRKAQAIW